MKPHLRSAVSLFCAASALLAMQTRAAESEIAHRNLGLAPKALEKARAAQDAASGKTAKTEPPGEQVQETITVYGAAPEDYSKPGKAPIQAFAERLDKSVKLTPAQKTQRVLSFFLGGPMPETEPSAEARTLSRSERSGTMMQTPRGALQ